MNNSLFYVTLLLCTFELCLVERKEIEGVEIGRWEKKGNK